MDNQKIFNYSTAAVFYACSRPTYAYLFISLTFLANANFTAQRFFPAFHIKYLILGKMRLFGHFEM
jgi:hypothetical protein